MSRRPELEGVEPQDYRTWAVAKHMVVPLRGAAMEPIDPRALMKKHLGVIRAALMTHKRPGGLVFAFDQRQDPIGSVWLEAGTDKRRAVVVGRHSRSGLLVPDEHASVALRHAVALVKKDGDGRPLVRLIDLNTDLGIEGPGGKRLQSISTDGPSFFGLGTVQLAVFMTGVGLELPDDPEKAFDALPPCALVDARAGVPEQPLLPFESFARDPPSPTRNAPPPQGRPWFERGGAHLVRGKQRERKARESQVPLPGCERSHTSISWHLPPVQTVDELCAPGEAPEIFLRVESAKGSRTFGVGSTALDRGILVGRYDRCHIVAHEEQTCLSRVHAMFVRDGGDILVIDTASTNGTWIGDDELMVRSFSEAGAFRLAHELLVSWQHAH